MELSVENLSLSLSGTLILRDLCLTVRDGELLSLLGPSGCGKSTLLKAIAGLLPQDSGQIRLGGIPADPLPPHKRGAVIVFQDFRLFPHLTVAENIGFPLKMQGVAKSAYLKTAAEMLEKVQLGGFDRRRPCQLSGGQIQRVALARALAAKPKVLLLDEPFSSLDETLRQEMRELVKRLQRELGMTAVLVTHDRREALSLSDRIAVMMDGAILQCDTPEALYHHPSRREVADYFGETFYLPGRVEGGLFTCGLLSFRTNFPDGPYDAMLRPSAVRIVEQEEASCLITAVAFLGEEYRVSLTHDSGLSLCLNIPAPCSLEPGRRVAISIASERAVLFPKTALL